MIVGMSLTSKGSSVPFMAVTPTFFSEPVGIPKLIEDVGPQVGQIHDSERGPPYAVQDVRQNPIASVGLRDLRAAIAELHDHVLEGLIGILKLRSLGVGHDDEHRSRYRDLLCECDQVRSVFLPVLLDRVELLVLKALD